MRYSVTVRRQIADYFRTTVVVEADSPEAAQDAALDAVLESAIVWDFSECGDPVGDDTVDESEIEALDAEEVPACTICGEPRGSDDPPTTCGFCVDKPAESLDDEGVPA
jgi:rubrerythrin